MKSWIVGTVIAALAGAGGVVYLVAVPHGSPPAVQAPGPSAPTPPSAPQQVAGVLPPAAAALPEVLRFSIRVERTDQPTLNLNWTGSCQTLAMSIISCEIGNGHRMQDGSGIAVFLEQDRQSLGLGWYPQGVPSLSWDTAVRIPPGKSYEINGRGSIPNVRWTIPITEWRLGVELELGQSRIGGQSKEWQKIGRAVIKLEN